MLAEEEKLEIRAGRWSLDCPQMLLRSRAQDAEAFTGPGAIRFAADGAIAFKLYATRQARDETITFGHGAGTILPEDSYFDLEARDWKGRRWKAARLRARTQENPEMSSVIWSGEIPRLTCSSQLPREVPHGVLRMEILSDVKIPCNAIVQSEKSIGTETKLRSSAVAAAKFQAGCYGFLVEREEKGVSVDVTCPGPAVPPSLELRVIEALQFVLARWLSWSVLERVHGTSYELEIRGLQKGEGKPRLKRPLALQDVDLEGVVWKLFECYFEYVSRESSGNLHRISELVYSAIEGSEGSIQAMVLSLSVAVEGVLRAAFPDLCAPPANFLKQVENALDLIERSEIDKTARERIKSAIGMMTGLRAQQGLDELLRRGAVAKSEVEAWKRLRHKSAHGANAGDISDTAAMQTFLDRSFRLTVLLYRLIFTAIGYEGPYTDYGTREWPTAMQSTVKIDGDGERISTAEP